MYSDENKSINYLCRSAHIGSSRTDPQQLESNQHRETESITAQYLYIRLNSNRYVTLQVKGNNYVGSFSTGTGCTE